MPYKKKKRNKDTTMPNNNDEQKNKEQVSEQTAESGPAPETASAPESADIQQEAAAGEEPASTQAQDVSAPEEGSITVQAGEESASEELSNLKNQVDKLLKESAQYKDKWLRAEADIDNYKKRVHKEKLEQLKYGYETMIRELLPVIDNLERAIEYSKKHAQKDSLFEGVELTLKLLKKVIEGFGVTTINAVGQVFDPNFHEGIGMEESTEYEDNIVVREVEKGYLYNDRLIRPAKVVVGKKAAAQDVHEQA